ncbi:MAG: 2-C-methyl-D-erythritol 2,4-cyclodiphosphate synthase [Armatimonadetes bacterium]|nr:2-C-methyl-D-erythritol 2,4-cyclodiphosphate synthase [Armatimonadota bacterium]MDW8121653.1 2-C-methyl-D-erythritol 2,4-cyclodiphosphate synthase [Armatimonadota bacterium]
MEWRVGIGVDAHPLSGDRPLILCGVAIPHPKGLMGHSDGDAALHALCDALLGALGWGDIGQWFPPSKPEYQGADSRQFVLRIMEQIRAAGWSVVNADITVVAEEPKLAPYRDQMRQVVADLLAVPTKQVSVKATTTNALGFVGRQEGIAAVAIVALSKG